MSERQPTKLHVEYLALLKELCGDNQEALRWLAQVLQLALVWDHVHDGDEFTPAEVDEVFQYVLLDWPQNQFWTRYQLVLMPVLSNVIANWLHGNRVREYQAYVDVPCAVALLIGGTARRDQYAKRLIEWADSERQFDDGNDKPEVKT